MLKGCQIKTITDEEDKVQAEYEYFNNDNVKSVTLGNGVKNKKETRLTYVR